MASRETPLPLHLMTERFESQISKWFAHINRVTLDKYQSPLAASEWENDQELTPEEMVYGLT